MSFFIFYLYRYRRVFESAVPEWRGCENLINEYLCTCPTGFSGVNCQTGEYCLCIIYFLYQLLNQENYQIISPFEEIWIAYL